jgi:protein-L-isoaspartate(D-aspartate) O-methyltransferase
MPAATVPSKAFAKGGWQQVTRLYRDQAIAEQRCWVRGPGWCLATS